SGLLETVLVSFMMSPMLDPHDALTLETRLRRRVSILLQQVAPQPSLRRRAGVLASSFMQEGLMLKLVIIALSVALLPSCATPETAAMPLQQNRLSADASLQPRLFETLGAC